MRRLVAFVAVAVLGMMLADAAISATVRVSEGANGTAVTLRAGDRLLVSLRSNRSTGYRWRIVSVDRNVFWLGAFSYRPPRSNLVWGASPGAPGTQSWTFRALRSGVVRLRLAYVQATSGRVGKRFRLTIRVRS
jgi:inhibitor of cysteine peptidase